jgi:hypothetical protein
MHKVLTNFTQADSNPGYSVLLAEIMTTPTGQLTVFIQSPSFHFQFSKNYIFPVLFHFYESILEEVLEEKLLFKYLKRISYLCTY